MGVGAKDYIDQMLVKRYAKENANNLEDANVMAITNDRYWEIMKDIAQVHHTMAKVANFAKKGVKTANTAKSKA